jgi:hypothetical protein
LYQVAIIYSRRTLLRACKLEIDKMKKIILNWLLKDSDLLAYFNKLTRSVETVDRLESLAVLIRDVKMLTTEAYDLSSKVDDIEEHSNMVEYELQGFRDEYDFGSMDDMIDDHTSAIETLEARLDEIVSPDGFEVRLTAKIDSSKVSK